MKKLTMLAGLAVFFAFSATGWGSPILVDFGTNATTDLTLGGTWNSVTLTGMTSGNINYLMDSDNVATTVTLEAVTSNWQVTSSAQPNWGANKDWVDTDATVDYIWVGATNAAFTNETIRIAGLTAGGKYTISLTAIRQRVSTSISRLADYTVNGSFADTTPNGDNFDAIADGYLNRDILTWDSVTASGTGTIDLAVSTSLSGSLYGSAFVNALKIDVVPEPATMAILASGGVMVLIRRRRRG